MLGSFDKMLPCFNWLLAVWRWLTSPSVLPLAGAAAAVIAAMSLAPREWLRNPRQSIVRVLQVVAVWLIVAWLLSAALPHGGAGSGQGGGAGDGKGPSAASDKVAKGASAENGKTKDNVLRPAFPEGSPENLVLVVRFVPSATQPEAAEDFRCQLVTRRQTVSVQGADMLDFEKQLSKELKALPLPNDVKDPLASIQRAPFAGNGVLHKVQQKVRTVLPHVTVKLSD